MDRSILSDTNKNKTLWKIINKENWKSILAIDIESLVTNNTVIMNQNQIANIFNNYFLSIVDSIISDNNIHENMTNTIYY